MKQRARRSSVVLALAIAATLAVGLVGTGGRVSAAASHTSHAEWNYAHYEGPYGFDAWTCDLPDWCVATPYTWNGFLAWDYQRETSSTDFVTTTDVATDVPDGICCGPFSMDAYTNNYVYNSNGTYVGDMKPDTQPNGHYDCTVAQDDAISCVAKYWGWFVSFGGTGSVEFDHSNFIATNDDKNTFAGGDVYYYWA